MKTLPYTPLPITHKARAYVSADKTNVASMIEEWVEQHSHIEVCGLDRNRIGDDYDEMERTAWIDSPGAFK